MRLEDYNDPDRVDYLAASMSPHDMAEMIVALEQDLEDSGCDCRD